LSNFAIRSAGFFVTHLAVKYVAFGNCQPKLVGNDY